MRHVNYRRAIAQTFPARAAPRATSIPHQGIIYARRTLSPLTGEDGYATPPALRWARRTVLLYTAWHFIKLDARFDGGSIPAKALTRYCTSWAQLFTEQFVAAPYAALFSFSASLAPAFGRLHLRFTYGKIAVPLGAAQPRPRRRAIHGAIHRSALLRWRYFLAVARHSFISPPRSTIAQRVNSRGAVWTGGTEHT